VGDIHGCPFKPTEVGLSDKAPLNYRQPVAFLEGKLSKFILPCYIQSSPDQQSIAQKKPRLKK